MKNSLMLATAATALIAALSGCGSSKSTTNSSAAATSAPTSSTAAKGGRYGSQGASTTAATAATGATGATGVSLSVKHDKLGTVLAAGPKKLTVYLFESDHANASSCSGECAKAWPPVTTQGSAVAGAGAQASDIGTITRADGSKQVTYKGHPLYYFVRDKDSGDAYGQGIKAFGAAWYVLSPAGVKIDPS